MKSPFFIRQRAWFVGMLPSKITTFLAPFVFIVITTWLLMGLSGCGGNEIQLPQQRLTGQIAGEDWDMKFANGYIFSSDLKYQLKFLSTKEGGDDPCAVPSTANTHISIIMQLQVRSYSLPLPIVEESVRFQFGNGSSSIATSGFLEIYDINNSRVFGYLQAQLDDDNTVEGSFEAFICN